MNSQNPGSFENLSVRDRIALEVVKALLSSGQMRNPDKTIDAKDLIKQSFLFADGFIRMSDTPA